MIALLLAIAASLGLATVGAFYIGRRVGFDHGANAEWLRQYYSRIEAEKARRAANGQFRRVAK